MSNIREAIVSAFQRKIVRVQLPNVGEVDLPLRPISAFAWLAIKDQADAEIAAAGENQNGVTLANLKAMARIVSAALVDDQGNRVYQDSEYAELCDHLGAEGLGTLFAETMKAMGIAAPDDAVKNSQPDLSESTPTN